MSHPSGSGWGGFDDDDDDDDAFDDGGGANGEPMGTIDKPDEFLAIHGVTTELFERLRRWFDIPSLVTLDLTEVDSAVEELGDPQMVIALAMRKLQALHLLATPGVRTTTDVVVAIVNDLERALVQAPNMWLKRSAAATDWDQAFVALSDEDRTDLHEAPVEADEVDPEVLHFRTLHGALHDAMFAVIEASEGQIRELE